MRMILLTAALLTLTISGCASAPATQNGSSPPPRKMKALVLTPQERTGRQLELAKDDGTKTSVDGNLVR